ncbi:MAG: polysaccharide deacetylase family protein [Actinomycetota bacterium]
MIAWPGGARAAVAFTFDFDAEEVWIGEDPANAERPGILSQGTYGAKVAVPLVLDVLARRGVRASFFVPGRVAERHPDRVREIVAGGHELAHHGYTHTSPTKLSPEEEERELLRGREVLASFGVPITGYRSPSWDFSAATLGLLERHGFAYSSNLMDDIRPYRHAGGAVVEVPIQWILDDAPHFWFDPASWTKKISTVEEVRSIWEAEVRGIVGLGGAAIVTCHPQVIGRPGRIGFLEEFIATVQSLPDVWIATTAEIAALAP